MAISRRYLVPNSRGEHTPRGYTSYLQFSLNVMTRLFVLPECYSYYSQYDTSK